LSYYGEKFPASAGTFRQGWGGRGWTAEEKIVFFAWALWLRHRVRRSFSAKMKMNDAKHAK
jgi:hypothetical protein